MLATPAPRPPTGPQWSHEVKWDGMRILADVHAGRVRLATRAEVDARPGRFTIWYGDESDRLVGVLAYNADDDYERGEALIAQGADLAAARAGAHHRPAPASVPAPTR